MNIKLNLAIILVSAGAFLSSCSKSKEGKFHPDKPLVDSTPLVTLSSSWKKAIYLMDNFPNGIQIYVNTTPINGKSISAYAVIFDPKADLELKPVMAASEKTVTSFYNNEPGTKYASINGGFFGSPNNSYSLVMYNTVVSAVNIKSLTRVYNSVNTTYYPTRAAFGISAAGVPDVTWIYHVGTGDGTIFSYSSPALNQLNTAPLPVPTAILPTVGKVWDVKSAIGGSPMLIKDDKINITDAEELIVIDNTSSRARSAIGYTKNNKIIILAVEGGNTAAGIPGVNLAELAQMMKDMGCVGAINLDGGGSTALTVNGKQTVKPSDGSERKVVTALIVKEKL
ncbi:MAG: phosphodiester glycosidase family protein [Candidatus Pedobacter colombiensis]|uniref:Phosphodiester glycosidase family protein n=1 Tax=Candidatus Pedobacter colombiensis TaxID=3121371 RepID=A0AAJ6B5Q7_9SPHI|nr:phosphodiester glycosidase family protein [Pedobacter sp.]WEK18064.1 MAG: phosphodiester glycosidase family protein [Pedobacter sp.]